MPVLRANGIDVYYERGGMGPRLLFFNGSGSTLETSRPLIEALRGRFDVVAHDQRGLGRTSVPDSPGTMADYTADAAVLLDHVGWSSCRVFGISFGGMVAQEFSVTWRERVERLALACTSPGGAGGSSYPLQTLADLSPRERAEKGLGLLDTRFSAAWFEEHPEDLNVISTYADRQSAPRTAEQRRGEAIQLEARSHHDVYERLPRITCPTLVAAGRYDAIAPLSNSEAIASRIVGSELRVYEGGHLFVAQDRAALPDLFDFLADDPNR